MLVLETRMDNQICHLFLMIDELDSLKQERPRDNAFPDLVLYRFDDFEFQRHFRIARASFDMIVSTLALHWTRRNSLKVSMLCFIWDLATGDSYRSLSTRFGFGETSLKVNHPIIAKHLINLLGHFVWRARGSSSY